MIVYIPISYLPLTCIYSTVKCFKWRTAERCMDGADLRCSLKERYSFELSVIQGRSVPLRSPGYDHPIPFYHNNNFCIYNVSLDCPGEVVHLQSKSANFSLEDEGTCQDYLWFNTSTSTHQTVDNKICGKSIGYFNAT